MIATTLWLCSLTFLLAGGLSQVLLLRRLRRHHEDTWRDLGEPSLLFNMSMRNQARLSGFLWKSEYRALNDPTTVRLALTVKVLTVVVGSLLLSGFVLTLYRMGG